MDRMMTAVEQKLAEKLTILNDRGLGMLTRIYNIKKACSDPKSRPAFLNDKSLESAVKIIVKKFPAMENSKAPHMQNVMQRHLDVVKGLSNYYLTFVDVMLFKDHASELLTSIDANFVHFDITLNFELTKAYFSLITTYACLFVLISKVDDRKAVLSLFNHAYEMQKGHGEHNYPRLGQMIIDYENPFRKLCEEFTPHAQRIGIALSSLNVLYRRRNLGGEQMRQAQLLSLTNMPQQMLSPALSEEVPCEYVPLEELSRWILIACTLCPSQITAQSTTLDVWRMCLQDGFCVTLFRDEVLYIHKELQSLFESIKGLSKRVKEVQDCLIYSLQHSASFHRERRRYLQTALDEMNAIFSDQPGLLGPKVLIALLALCHARDEVNWLVRHKYHAPPKGKKVAVDDYDDVRLPKFLHSILELRELFKKYSQVIQRYFVQYLSGFDVALLKTIIQRISVCPEDESLIMTQFVETLSSLNVKQVDAGENIDFQGIRLDWMRLQAYTSVRGCVPELKENRDLAVLMNTIVMHTKLVDVQDDILNEVSDLSVLCFYPSFFETSFKSCLENPSMMRFSIAYPLICGHFLNCTHNLCPEERHPIGERSLSAVNSFLDAIALKATQYISQLCEEHLRLSRQLDPGNAVNFHEIAEGSRLKKDRPRPIPPKPGQESRKKTVETQKPIDTKFQGQVELLQAITLCKDITVWEHVFTPREYLVTHLEEFFSKTISRLLNYNEATHEIARPSSLLKDIQSYIFSLHRLEELVNLDMGRIFNATLLQQTQNCDNSGGPTLTSTYTFWYNDILIKKILNVPGTIYSTSRLSFISMQKAGFPRVEDFTDIGEMKALAELLGAYGVRHFSKKLVQRTMAEIEELKKLVLVNKDILAAVVDAPLHYDVFDVMKKIRNFDDLIGRSISVGIYLTFRNMINTGIRDVLPRRVPYLMMVLDDFKENNTRNESTLTHEMAQAGGIDSEFDAELYHALRNSREKNDDEGIIWEYLLAFWAVSLSVLAFKDNTEFNAVYKAHENNAHCLASVFNLLPQALFTISGEILDDKMKIFLKIATTGLLQLGLDQGPNSGKDSIPRQLSSAYILIDLIVKESLYMSQDELDNYLPYTLVRNAYNQMYKKHRVLTYKRGDASNQEMDVAG